MEVPELRRTVESRGSPSGIAQASPGMMQSKTSLRFALDATQSCIGELIEDCFLMGPGTPSLSNQIYSTAAARPPLGCKLAEVVTSPLGGLGAALTPQENRC